MTKMLKTIAMAFSIAVGAYSSCALASDDIVPIAGLTDGAYAKWAAFGSTKVTFTSAANPAFERTNVSLTGTSDAWLKAATDIVAASNPSAYDVLKTDTAMSVSDWLKASSGSQAVQSYEWTKGFSGMQFKVPVVAALSGVSGSIDYDGFGYAQLTNKVFDLGPAGDLSPFIRGGLDGSDRI